LTVCWLVASISNIQTLHTQDCDSSDDFAEEVKATRKNMRLMKYLDARTAKSKGQKRIPIAGVRRRLGLK
jgi:hypothetical protein